MGAWRAITICAGSTQGSSSVFVFAFLLISNRFFYKHELLERYDWYWRVEPDIKYFCDIT